MKSAGSDALADMVQLCLSRTSILIHDRRSQAVSSVELVFGPRAEGLDQQGQHGMQRRRQQQNCRHTKSPNRD